MDFIIILYVVIDMLIKYGIVLAIDVQANNKLNHQQNIQILINFINEFNKKQKSLICFMNLMTFTIQYLESTFMY